ncbi:Hypothetical predicted protein [Pelobates cultripes]|uniref:Uncharacterized protein n=1 Tax=Pelobates cultripes TaxID=61616 RepID=A0AAD1WVQ4_PELCU|nr:Hypothetical predicted protein [Pelobates cultripes]
MPELLCGRLTSTTKSAARGLHSGLSGTTLPTRDWLTPRPALCRGSDVACFDNTACPLSFDTPMGLAPPEAAPPPVMTSGSSSWRCHHPTCDRSSVRLQF